MFELPAELFNDVTEATIESWVRSDASAPRQPSKWFDAGTATQRIDAGTGQFPASFYVHGRFGSGEQARATVANVMREGQWRHVALVVGRTNVQLYVDGALATSHRFSGGLPQAKNGARVQIGKTIATTERWLGDFNGLVDEIRIWKLARNATDIRAGMFAALEGTEPGLIGLWRFDDGSPRDATAHGFHGKFIDNAHCIAAQLPDPAHYRAPAFVAGVVQREDKSLAAWTRVNLEQDGAVLASMYTDGAGAYAFLFYPTNALYDVLATGDKLRAKSEGIEAILDKPVVAPLVLSPNVSMAGTVRAADSGDPISAAVVEAVKLDADDRTKRLVNAGAITRAKYIVRSDDQGHFRFLDLKPGRYQIRCHGWGEVFSYKDGAPCIVAAEQPILDIDFRLPHFKRGRLKLWTPSAEAASAASNLQSPSLGSHGILVSSNQIWRLAADEARPLLAESQRESISIRALASGAGETLWIGTQRGVFRHGNREPGTLRLALTTAHGLPDNGITALCDDRRGGLWIGTDLGLAYYQNRAAKLMPSPAPTRFISSLALAPNGDLWCGTLGDGAFRFDGAHWTRIGRTNGLPDERVWCLYPEPDGELWIGTGRGAVRFEGTNASVLGPADGLANASTRAICRDRTGTLWLGTDNGLVRIEHGNVVNLTAADGLPHSSIIDLALDGAANLWVMTGNGICSIATSQPSPRPVSPTIGHEQAPLETRKLPGAAVATVATIPIRHDRRGKMSGAPIQLTPRWHPGTRYVYRLDVEDRNSYTYGPNATLWQEGSTLGMTLVLKAATNTSASGTQLQFSCLAIDRMQRGEAQVWLDFDSKGDLDPKAAGNPMIQALRRMIGPMITIHLDVSNQVSKLVGYDEFIRAAASNAPPWVASDLKQSFSEAFLKQLAQGRDWLPTQAVPAESSTLRTRFHLPADSDAHCDLTTTCKGWELRDGRRTVRVNLAGAVIPSTASPRGGNWPVNGGRAAASLWFDPKLGALTELRLDQIVSSAPAESGTAQYASNSRRTTLKLVALEP